jgi:hypothetical protein
LLDQKHSNKQYNGKIEPQGDFNTAIDYSEDFEDYRSLDSDVKANQQVGAAQLVDFGITDR